MSRPRRDWEPPRAVAEWGWRFHHLGIPTTQAKPGEVYLERLKLHVAGFPTSPFGVEWMRFDPDSPIAGLVREVPHVAFEVDDLDAALAGQTLIGEPDRLAEGGRVAMILHNGMPVELLEFAHKGEKS